MSKTRKLAAVALVGLALTAAGCGGDDEEAADTEETTAEPVAPGTALQGSVGPGFDISLEAADGGSVSTVAPGSYELEVEDLSDIHNFHLTGPGVDVSTDVGEEGTQSFEVELEAGTYEFVCDPHAGQMNGSFEVSG
jgi:plastocyanin